MDTSDNQPGPSEHALSPNVNCLSGKCCPKCGSYGPFEIEVSMRVLLFDSGSDDAADGSIEFTDDSPAVCWECKYEGKFGEFNVP